MARGDRGISNQRSVGTAVVIGSIYCDASSEFNRGIHPLARTIKAEKNDLGIVEMNEKKLGNIYGFDGGNYAGNVYDKTRRKSTAYGCSGSVNKAGIKRRLYQMRMQGNSRLVFSKQQDEKGAGARRRKTKSDDNGRSKWIMQDRGFVQDTQTHAFGMLEAYGVFG